MIGASSGEPRQLTDCNGVVFKSLYCVAHMLGFVLCCVGSLMGVALVCITWCTELAGRVSELGLNCALCDVVGRPQDEAV